MHLGSGARIQRVFNKALAGQTVTISVLGGSGITFSLSSFRTPQTQQTNDYPQCRHATVQGTTLYPLHATHPASSSGGTPSLPTRLRNLQTAPCDARISGTLGTATPTIFQIKRIWLLLSWMRGMNRTFLSFIFCFFSYHPFFFLFFLLLFVIGLAWPPCAHPKYHTSHTALSSPNRRTFPDQARVAAHEAIPSCSSARLLTYPIPWLHSSSLGFYPFHIFHQLCLPL